ncbi:MAG: hypothetical protein ABL925_02155 [Methylococcales bacterium]
MKRSFNSLMFIFLLVSSHLAPAVSYSTFNIYISSDTPKFTSLTSNMPTTKGFVSIDLKFIYSSGNKFLCSDDATIDGLAVSCSGIQKGARYGLSIKSRTDNTRVTFKGLVGATQASAAYKGAKGKLTGAKVVVVSQSSAPVVSEVFLNPIKGVNGKLTGTGQIKSTYSGLLNDGLISGRINKSAVAWSLSSSGNKISFKGKEQNNSWIGKLTGNIGPAKVSQPVTISLNTCTGSNCGSTSATPTGLLWHQDYALNYKHGSQVADLAGLRNRLIDANETAVPTRDGLHYVIFEYNIHTDITLVSIKETASGNTVYQASFNGYVRKIRPAPSNLSVLLVTWGSSAISNDEDFNIVDMAAKKILDTLPAQNAGMDWLPDGRYVHLGSTGILRVGIVGGSRTESGLISVPGRAPRALWANGEGTKIITRWVVLDTDGNVADTDVWISGLDGSGLERLTVTNRTSYVVWSPDSQWVAFNEDAASVCSGFGCSDVAGYCYLWAGDVSVRNLVEGSTAVSEFLVLDKDGKRRVLGCGSGLLGWTP